MDNMEKGFLFAVHSGALTICQSLNYAFAKSIGSILPGLYHIIMKVGVGAASRTSRPQLGLWRALDLSLLFSRCKPKESTEAKLGLCGLGLEVWIQNICLILAPPPPHSAPPVTPSPPPFHPPSWLPFTQKSLCWLNLASARVAGPGRGVGPLGWPRKGGRSLCSQATWPWFGKRGIFSSAPAI